MDAGIGREGAGKKEKKKHGIYLKRRLSVKRSGAAAQLRIEGERNA